MELLISLKFDDKTKENLMVVMEELKKCSRKGMFFTEQNLRLTVAEALVDAEELKPIKKMVNELSLKPFGLKFTGIDRSRRDGGDIYWVVCEINEELKKLREDLAKSLEEQGYQYDKESFRPRVKLGSNIIARPNFKFEEFECEVKEIALEKHRFFDRKDRFKSIFERKF